MSFPASLGSEVSAGCTLEEEGPHPAVAPSRWNRSEMDTRLPRTRPPTGHDTSPLCVQHSA